MEENVRTTASPWDFSQLEKLFSTTFGPNGQDVVLQTDGHCLASNYGEQILEAIVSHQAGRILRQAVHDYYKNAGDGSKKFVLISTTALRELEGGIFDAATQLSASRYCYHLLATVTSTFWPKLLSLYQCQYQMLAEEFELVVQHVLDTSLASHHSYAVRQKLKEMLQCVLVHHSEDKISQVQYLLDNFEDLVTLVGGASISESLCKPGLFLEQTMAWGLRAIENRSQVAAVLVEFAFCPEEDDSKPILQIQTHSELSKFQTHWNCYVRKVLEHLKQLNVQLLIIRDSIPGSVCQMLKELEICTLESVSQEVMSILQHSSGVVPLCSFQDAMLVGQKNLIFLSGPQRVVVGEAVLLHLVGLSSGVCILRPVSFVLCAPTIGMARQLKLAVKNCFKVLLGLVKDSDLQTLAGGGSWEIDLARMLLTNPALSNKGSVEWVVNNALKQGLLAVPRCLLATSAHPSQYKKQMIRLHQVVNSQARVTIDVVEGRLREAGPNWNVQEPQNSQQLLVCGVLVFLSQILRIDWNMACSVCQVGMSNPCRNSTKRWSTDTDDDEDQ